MRSLPLGHCWASALPARMRRLSSATATAAIRGGLMNGPPCSALGCGPRCGWRVCDYGTSAVVNACATGRTRGEGFEGGSRQIQPRGVDEANTGTPRETAITQTLEV